MDLVVDFGVCANFVLCRKFFSTPAGYKPPPEPKPSKQKEDVEMSIILQFNLQS